MTSVEYRPVLGFPGYFVGSDGSVWTAKAKGGNDRRPRIASEWKRLSVHQNRAGYLIVNLDHNGKNYTRQVHRLVLEAFVAPRPDGMEACHYPDPDKTNNGIDNLRWDTHVENAKDSYRDRGEVTAKRCRRCGDSKSRDEFYSDKRASDGLKTECKSCHCRVSYKTADKSKRRQSNREYMRKRRDSTKST